MKRLKAYYPADKELGRRSALVAFWCQESGGLRTVRARDIIQIK